MCVQRIICYFETMYYLPQVSPEIFGTIKLVPL